MAEDDGADRDGAGRLSGGLKTARRGAGGRFARGTAAGPGRPKGARNRAQAMLDAIAEAGAAAVARAVVLAAARGDVAAAKLLLDRIWPPARDRVVKFALPPVASAADLVPAASAVTVAMARGTVTPKEAAAVLGVVEAAGRVITVAELEARIRSLEAAVAPSAPSDAGG